MTAGHVDVPAGIADERSWDAMVPLLNRTGYRAIRFDQRDMGRSTTEDVEFSRIDDLVAVLNASGVERAALVGNSMGGMLAFDTAIVAPDRVVAAKAPDARALVWPDVAHMIGMEQSERLAATIVDFLAPLERWS